MSKMPGYEDGIDYFNDTQLGDIGWIVTDNLTHMFRSEGADFELVDVKHGYNWDKAEYAISVTVQCVSHYDPEIFSRHRYGAYLDSVNGQEFTATYTFKYNRYDTPREMVKFIAIQLTDDIEDQLRAGLNSFGEVTASRKIKSSIDSDIAKYKKALQNKAKRGGIYENFGQAEIRKLRDKYSELPDGDTDVRTAERNYNSIREFEDWCVNYVGASTSVKASKDGAKYTIKSVSDEGEYYLVKDWRKNKELWVSKAKMDSNPQYWFTSSAKALQSLKSLLNVMFEDYGSDDFFIVDDMGNETPVNLNVRKNGLWEKDFDVFTSKQVKASKEPNEPDAKKTKLVNEIIKRAKEIRDYFSNHNNNLNRRQDEILEDLSDGIDNQSISAIRDAVENMKYNSKNLRKEQYSLIIDLYDDFNLAGGKYQGMGYPSADEDDVEACDKVQGSKKVMSASGLKYADKVRFEDIYPSDRDIDFFFTSDDADYARELLGDEEGLVGFTIEVSLPKDYDGKSWEEALIYISPKIEDENGDVSDTDWDDITFDISDADMQSLVEKSWAEYKKRGWDKD